MFDYSKRIRVFAHAADKKATAVARSLEKDQRKQALRCRTIWFCDTELPMRRQVIDRTFSGVLVAVTVCQVGEPPNNVNAGASMRGLREITDRSRKHTHTQIGVYEPSLFPVTA